MKKQRKRINWSVIESNLVEAKEQIEATLKLIREKSITVERLQVDLEHATHHLYFGWNARNETKKTYSHLSEAQFNAWSKVPKEFWMMSIEKNKTIGDLRKP